MSWAVATARVKPKGNAIIITKQCFWHCKDQSVDGSVQRNRLDGSKPSIGAAEHICD
jgi:hypothetical protein